MSAASTGAKEQVARLLTLVPFLHAKGEVRLDDAARSLGISERQLVKVLRVLFMCGLPGGLPDDLIDVDIDALVDPDGDRVIRVSNADYLSRPLRLNPTEATAIIVALRALRGGAVSDDSRDVIDRALAKVEQAAADGAARAPNDPGDIATDAQLASLSFLLSGAVRGRRQVRLTYFVPSRDEESERVVDPRAVVHHDGVDYLDAWCHCAEATRLFRLDRIRTATVLDTPVTTEGEPRDLSDGFFTQASGLTTATLRLTPNARWVTEYYAVDAVRPGPDGTLDVDLPIAEERWLLRLLLRLAPDATVVAPAELATAFGTIVGEALGLYDLAEPPAPGG